MGTLMTWVGLALLGFTIYSLVDHFRKEKRIEKLRNDIKDMSDTVQRLDDIMNKKDK